MAAITLDGAKNLAIAITIGFVVLAVASAMMVKNITSKIIAVVLMVGFALGVWTQRNELQDCAQRVKDKAAVGDTSATTCTFFGLEVDVPEVAVL